VSDARLRRLERDAHRDPAAAARLEDERARQRPRWLPSVRSELLDGDGIAATTCAALLNGFEVVNRRDFLAPDFVPQTRGPPPTFFHHGWEWIDPLREAQEVQLRIAGMTAGMHGLAGQPVYLGDDGAVRFDPLGTFLGVAIQASPDANGTVTIRMGRQETQVDIARLNREREAAHRRARGRRR
jgi:hypothetical protein